MCSAQKLWVLTIDGAQHLEWPEISCHLLFISLSNVLQEIGLIWQEPPTSFYEVRIDTYDAKLVPTRPEYNHVV